MSAYEWRDAPSGPRYAVIGDPIAHSKSPAMQTAAFQALGMDEPYVAIRVPEDDFDEALERLISIGYVGLNVTLPLKGKAAAWAETVSPLVSQIQSANTLDLVKSRAESTDGPGFITDLARFGTFERALLWGAGGSARAVAHALRCSGIQVTVWARRLEQAETLASEVEGFVARQPDVRGYDLVIDATSAGLHGKAIDVEWSSQAGLAYALAYGDAAKPFLAEATLHGWRTTDGVGMLVAQGALAFEFWTGQPAPIEAMRAAVTNL